MPIILPALLTLLEPEPLMPGCKRLLGINIEALIARTGLNLDPRRLRAEHQMRMLERHRQRAVDGRGERMHELGPARIPNPQAAAAVPAEAALCRALLHMAVRVFEHGLIYADVLAPLDFERGVFAAQIDRITATTGRFTADGAIAPRKRIRVP